MHACMSFIWTFPRRYMKFTVLCKVYDALTPRLFFYFLDFGKIEIIIQIKVFNFTFLYTNLPSTGTLVHHQAKHERNVKGKVIIIKIFCTHTSYFRTFFYLKTWCMHVLIVEATVDKDMCVRLNGRRVQITCFDACKCRNINEQPSWVKLKIIENKE